MSDVPPSLPPAVAVTRAIPVAVPLPPATLRALGFPKATTPKEIFDFLAPRVYVVTAPPTIAAATGPPNRVLFAHNNNSYQKQQKDNANDNEGVPSAAVVAEESDAAKAETSTRTLLFNGKHPIRLVEPAPEFYEKGGIPSPTAMVFATLPNTYRLFGVPIRANGKKIAEHWRLLNLLLRDYKKLNDHWYVHFVSPDTNPPPVTQWFGDTKKTIYLMPASPVTSWSTISFYPEMNATNEPSSAVSPQTSAVPPTGCLPPDKAESGPHTTDCDHADDKLAGKKRPQESPLSVSDLMQTAALKKKKVTHVPIDSPFESDLLGNWSLLFSQPRNEEIIENLFLSHKYWITEATKLLQTRSLLTEVAVTRRVSSINIVGDLHGSWDCLKQLSFSAITVGKEPSDSNLWIFNGDFVDRGAFGIEVLATLCQLLVKNPQSVFLNRGNHESSNMGMGNLNHLRCLIAAYGYTFGTTATPLLRHLLWGEPSNETGIQPSALRKGFLTWGPDITEAFLEANQLSMVIRSHNNLNDGFCSTHDGKVLTVFSSVEQCRHPMFWRKVFTTDISRPVPLDGVKQTVGKIMELYKSLEGAKQS
ncbi:serine/threonine protein phosphatase [Pelomyxa schiedti]|nr:serine/threonine protein phosphatase [Pelomyxa schiedti]